MKSLAAFALVVLSSLLALKPAAAGVSPYFRVAFSENQLKMSEVNAGIMRSQEAIRAAGYPADFQKIGYAMGPDASAGLWLFSWFRVGATYSYQRSYRENRVHVPGQLFYDDQLGLRMTEVGGEAAIRISRLAGLSVGGEVAQAHAKLIEGYTVEQPGYQYYADGTAERTKTTYGAFVGIDQTNSSGYSGFIRAGYRFRDIGSMPSKGTVSDGTNSASFTGNTFGMDYSGFYVTLGMGFDLVR